MSAPEPTDAGFVTRRLVQFGRTLREAGFTISAQQLGDVSQALTVIDLSRQADFYFTLRSFLIHSPDERELFDRLFELFWLGRSGLLMEMGTSRPRGSADRPGQTPKARPTPSTGSRVVPTEEDAPPEEGHDPSIAPTYSQDELLRHKDFGEYSETELEAARVAMQNLLWRMDERATRRFVRTGKQAATLDLPRVIRTSIRRGGEIVEFSWRRRKRKPRPLVVICDVSGSMERYSRLFLFLMYSLVHETARIEDVRLRDAADRITPALRHTDVQTAMARASDLVLDWSGGTRIGESLRTFNFRWSRRVLGHGAVVLIISDGWDRGDQAVLGVGDPPAASQRPPADLAQPAGRQPVLPAAGARHPDHPAARGRDAAAAQPGEHGQAGRKAGRGRTVNRGVGGWGGDGYTAVVRTARP